MWVGEEPFPCTAAVQDFRIMQLWGLEVGQVEREISRTLDGRNEKMEDVSSLSGEAALPLGASTGLHVWASIYAEVHIAVGINTFIL